MNKSYRIPQWATLLIGLTAASVVRVTCNKIKENNERDAMFADLKVIVQKKGNEMIKDSTIKKKWCECIINNIKERYPEGISHISPSTIRQISEDISSDCISSVTK